MLTESPSFKDSLELCHGSVRRNPFGGLDQDYLINFLSEAPKTLRSPSISSEFIYNDAHGSHYQILCQQLEELKLFYVHRYQQRAPPSVGDVEDMVMGLHYTYKDIHTLISEETERYRTKRGTGRQDYLMTSNVVKGRMSTIHPRDQESRIHHASPSTLKLLDMTGIVQYGDSGEMECLKIMYSVLLSEQSLPLRTILTGTRCDRIMENERFRTVCHDMCWRLVAARDSDGALVSI